MYLRVPVRADTEATVMAAERRDPVVAGHAFVSYVREDSAEVDRLQRVLREAGIPVWRDKSDLWPGEDWQARIREAIIDDALVFIVCFSRNSLSKVKSYQNEELVLAVEQLRLRRTEQPWLIPVRFDDCRIPDRDLGGGRRLSSLQWVDLFDDAFDDGAKRLVAAIRRILGPVGTSQVGATPGRRDEGPRAASRAAGQERASPMTVTTATAGSAESGVQIRGPWSHLTVSANGTRFHLAEAGDGPLVLLLHGFPEFWWAWRNQLVSLPRVGFRAVAVDLRGYGGSEKPPRGYDLVTASADVAGLIRALGETNAVVVGHDWGGLIAWSLAAFFPKVVRQLAVVSMAHPLRMRHAPFTSSFGQGRRSGYAISSQLPVRPERQLVRDNAARVSQLLTAWSGPGWPDPETARTYQRAMRIPHVVHSALEYQRWFVRSTIRPDGLRYARWMRSPVKAPVLHLHGALDTCVLPQTARGAGRYVDGAYLWRVIEGAGHFPHEERPEAFDTALIGWLADPELTGEHRQSRSLPEQSHQLRTSE
jgi:pimeloyl-ACP methyl ester carboxylesterase